MITLPELIAVAVTLVIFMTGVAVAASYIYYLRGHKEGYGLARQRFRPDAMRWREHDRLVCADREAFVRFTHTMREMTEASGH